MYFLFGGICSIGEANFVILGTQQIGRGYDFENASECYIFKGRLMLSYIR